MKKLWMLALAVLLPFEAEAVELRISGAELASLLERAFTGTVMRLHSDQQVNGVRRPGSILRLPRTLGGVEYRFSVPPQDHTIAPGVRTRFAVNDVRTQTKIVQNQKPISVGATATAYVVTIRFEDEGAEIVNVPLQGRSAALVRRLVPDVEVNNIVLQIALLPRTGSRGEIVFLPPHVTFFADVQAGGVGNLNILGRKVDLLDELTGYRNEIKRGVEREVKKALQQQLPQIARAITTEVQRRGRQGQLDVTQVRFEGSTLVVIGRSRLISG